MFPFKIHQNKSRRLEDELILISASSTLIKENSTAIISICEKKLDWSYILSAASNHGVLPILYHSLNKTAARQVPADVMSQLKEKFRQNFLRNNLLAQELIAIIAEFSRHKIRAIPLKGPVLASAAYGGLGLRQFHDLDILVAEDDVLSCKKILDAHGYQLPPNQIDKSFDEIRKKNWHYNFSRKKDHLPVELHWRITPPSFHFPFDFEVLWQHRNFCTLLNTQMVNLANDMLLFILCVHGAKHAWVHLKWICDVAALLRHFAQKDWEKVVVLSANSRLNRPVLSGLFLAERLLEVKLPEKIQAMIQHNKQVKNLAEIAEKLIFETITSEFNKHRQTLTFRLYQLRIRAKLSDQLKELLSSLFYFVSPNENDRLLNLPKKLDLLYFFVRPFRLIFDLARGLSKKS